MLIGIITFWESNDNYGQVLQAFALQRILERLGHTPYQIKYSLSSVVTPVNKKNLLKRVLKIALIYPIIKHVISLYNKKKERRLRDIIENKNRVRGFANFRNENIRHDDRIYYSLNEIQASPPKADVYITGSDQVWNMSLSNFNNRAYFLDFGCENVKRLSYAASFAAKKYPKEHYEQLKTLLERFNAISVRENEGIEICNKVDLEAQKTLDPTLLLRKKDYLIIAGPKSATKPFVYIYSINVERPDELSWDEIKQYASRNNLETIVTTSSGNIPGREIFDDTKYLYATIPEWLSYINNSHVVITTSFHGIAFSLIMHSNFVYFPLKGERSRGNGRVFDLLKSVGLENKVANKGISLDNVINASIDWSIVDKELEKQRAESMQFLKNNI